MPTQSDRAAPRAAVKPATRVPPARADLRNAADPVGPPRLRLKLRTGVSGIFFSSERTRLHVLGSSTSRLQKDAGVADRPLDPPDIEDKSLSRMKKPGSAPTLPGQSSWKNLKAPFRLLACWTRMDGAQRA